jgi:succinoglycan biosynthesis protein ExoO
MADMEKTPDVAIIIAAYNVGTYIERAIQSALDQINVSVEVIVINDASTDDTSHVATSIKDKRLRCVDLPYNVGPGAARNVGLGLATASWIAVLDGDDYFLPDRLQRCLALAVSTHADIVADNLEIFREDDGMRKLMYPPKMLKALTNLSLAAFIRHNIFLFRRHSLGYLKPIFSKRFLTAHSLSYDPDIRIGEDYMLFARALAHGAKCVLDASAGYAYTVRIGSISHRLSILDIDKIIKGDQRFVCDFSLNSIETWSQKLRTFSLYECFYFTQLVEALKKRDLKNVVWILCRRPTVIFQLWEALWVRFRSFLLLGTRP